MIHKFKALHGCSQLVRDSEICPDWSGAFLLCFVEVPDLILGPEVS
jgi:hypothetical protein